MIDPESLRGRRWQRCYPAGGPEMLRYAATSGDFYALHYDPSSPEAHAMGGPVVPGRYRFGCVARGILDELPGAQIDMLDCDYVGPAPVGAELLVLVRVLQVDDDGRTTLRVATRDERGRVNLRGQAIVSFAPRKSQKP